MESGEGRPQRQSAFAVPSVPGHVSLFVSGERPGEFRKRRNGIRLPVASSVDIRKWTRRGLLYVQGREVVLVNGYLKWEQI